MSTYYNEIDPKAAAWLRELIKQGHIAKGEVDERSILEVQPDDLRGFTQCHFFAGIGVWSYALRLAGWADDRPVWTGSCPCQPFSAAGKGDEFADERHLWPAWFRLARELRPDAIFGEQVSSKDALSWFDHVRVDLEGEGYALGVLDTCAAGVGAPNIRQRLYFVADAQKQRINGVDGRLEGTIHEKRAEHDSSRRTGSLADSQCGSAERHGFELGSEARGSEGERDQRQRIRADVGHGECADALADAECTERRAHGQRGDVSEGRQQAPAEPGGNSATGELADANGRNASPERQQRSGEQRLLEEGGGARYLGDAEQRGFQEQRRSGRIPRCEAETGEREAVERTGTHPGAVNGFWANAVWVPCRDGKARPTEPGTFPLVTGAPARVVRLRLLGNAINAEQARCFIESYIEVRAG